MTKQNEEPFTPEELDIFCAALVRGGTILVSDLYRSMYVRKKGYRKLFRESFQRAVEARRAEEADRET